MRWLASFLWVFVIFAFGFDAIAQPCELRIQASSEIHQDMSETMPCLDGMMMAESSEPTQNEPHHTDTCCCVALLTNVVAVDGIDLTQPLPGITVWTNPLPQIANSVEYEYEPPPPRA